ncbi:MAG: hypothetical protein HQL53_09225, partial [Magnetococcales bacterium]|nr:hypothetical protein [Magnetococcales bacterium]
EFQGTQLRFGFRVYRDPYADPLAMDEIPGDGVGEGFPLPDECQMDKQEQMATFRKFQRSLSTVEVTQDDKDDYEENLFGGLRQALSKDLTACPDHLKLLFVIGDHGYKVGAKYQSPVNENELVKLLRGGDDPTVKGNNVIHFFIQTPARSMAARHPKAYTRAYQRFSQQAKDLLVKSLPLDSQVNDHFLQMEQETLVPKLVQTVGSLSRSSMIDEIILDVRGGQALDAVISRFKRQHIDIPGVFWHVLKKGGCGKLGERCQERVFDTTQVSYVEANDEAVEELWITSSALSSWIRILRGFEGYYELPEHHLRRALISALVLGLQQEIRKPPIDVSGETPAEYAQRRGGLPVRRHSPLLSYPVASLAAEHTRRDSQGKLLVVNKAGKPILDALGRTIEATPSCELRRLALWAIRSKEILEVVERNTTRPVFKSERYATTLCPGATANGRLLPHIVGTIDAQPLGPNEEYRYSHAFGGRRGYWVPKGYLP